MAARFDWDKIRAEYESGTSQSELSRQYGCCRAAIQKRIAKERWTQDVTEAINRLTAAKVAGVVAGCDPIKKAAAMDRAAEKKVAVIEKHKKEWEEHQQLINDAVKDKNFELAKLAKITSETIRIRQEGERRAWGIIDTDVRPRATEDMTQKIRDDIRSALQSVGVQS